MNSIIKYKKILFTVFILMVITSYVWFSYFKIDYSQTKWLSLQGYKSKGYEPYLEAVYTAEGKSCKDFIFGLGSSLAKNDKKILMSEISEDDLHYSIKYPMTFKQGGCTYQFGRGYIYIQEYNNLDEKKYPKRTTIRTTKVYDDFVGVVDIKYFKPDEIYKATARNANLLKVNQYCQKSIMLSSSERWMKVLDCHPEEYSREESYYFFKPFILEHPNFMYNIIVSEDVKIKFANKIQIERKNLKVYIEKFIPHINVFEKFKKNHNIIEE